MIRPQTISEEVKMEEETGRTVRVIIDAGEVSFAGLEDVLMESVDKTQARKRAERVFGTFSEIVIFDGRLYERVPGSHISYEIEGRVIREAKYISKQKEN